MNVVDRDTVKTGRSGRNSGLGYLGSQTNRRWCPRRCHRLPNTDAATCAYLIVRQSPSRAFVYNGWIRGGNVRVFVRIFAPVFEPMNRVFVEWKIAIFFFLFFLKRVEEEWKLKDSDRTREESSPRFVENIFWGRVEEVEIDR